MRRLRSINYLFLAALLFLTGCQPPGPRALLDGERLIRDGKYPEAITRLEKAVSLLPKNAQAWNHLGLAYQYAGKPDDAFKAYQQAITLDRNLAPVRFNIGILHLEQGRLNEAINELTTCTVLDPTAHSAHVNLGKAWLRAKRVEEAERAFATVLRADPKNVEALNYYGVTQLHRRKAPDARAYFNEALKLQPDYSPAVLNQAALNHYYIVNKTNALRLYKQYLGMQPDAAGAAAATEAVRVLESELQPKTVAVPVTPTAPTNRLVAVTNRQPTLQTNVAMTKPETRTNVVTAPPTNTLVSVRPTNIVASANVVANKPVPPTTTITNKAPEFATAITNALPASAVKTNEPPIARIPTPATNEPPKVIEIPEVKADPPRPLEVVKLEEEPKLAVAKDIPPPPAAITPKAAATKTLALKRTDPPAAETNIIAAMEEPPLIRPARREPKENSTSLTGTILKKANPVNWFRKDKEETKEAPEKIVAVRPQSTQTQSGVKELPEPPKQQPEPEPAPEVKPEPVFARYPYQSTALPAAGKRVSAEPLFNEAVAAHQEGKLGKAMDGYRAALRQDPRYFDAQLNLGIAAHQASDLSLALASLEDAVRLNPKSKEARYQFAIALRRANYPVDAVNELKTLTEEAPDEARAYLALGNLYAQVMNKPDEAVTNYQRVLELAPQHPQGPQIRAWLAHH